MKFDSRDSRNYLLLGNLFSTSVPWSFFFFSPHHNLSIIYFHSFFPHIICGQTKENKEDRGQFSYFILTPITKTP